MGIHALGKDVCWVVLTQNFVQTELSVSGFILKPEVRRRQVPDATELAAVADPYGRRTIRVETQGNLDAEAQTQTLEANSSRPSFAHTG